MNVLAKKKIQKECIFTGKMNSVVLTGYLLIFSQNFIFAWLGHEKIKTLQGAISRPVSVILNKSVLRIWQV